MPGATDNIEAGSIRANGLRFHLLLSEQMGGGEREFDARGMGALPADREGKVTAPAERV